MKFKLIIIFTLLISTVFSQEDRYADFNNKLRKYKLVNIFNDTIAVYGKTIPIEKLQKGFRVFDENGKRTRHKVTPDMNFKYIIFTEDNKTIVLKSVKSLINKVFYPYVNAFMLVYIDNSEEELKKGKISLYVNTYGVYSQMTGANTAIIIYFEDANGVHRINYKYHYKRYPKLLGKKVWDEKKASKKWSTDFLFEYFTKYNKLIDEKLKKE